MPLAQWAAAEPASSRLGSLAPTFDAEATLFVGLPPTRTRTAGRARPGAKRHYPKFAAAFPRGVTPRIGVGVNT
ncbi:hypothetical protein BT67DRAFT_443418 [Trichocladium antarcticum]|uniref:Uncharacterized protein n=1 Tax=Trichocladium antarcticum TaxID=1450529 RepID=A0AAN6ZBL1_9PEZI|nr:hypothetical protein BT67DRAFT_443418 [Trichocladium antarcticum]